MDMFFLYVIEHLIFLLCLLRCCLTDLRERKIENKVIVVLFFSKIVCWLAASLTVQEYVTLFIENGIFCTLLLLWGLKSKNIGAGDIKLLCVSKLYFNMDDAMKWILIMVVLLVLGYANALRRGNDKNARTAFAPYVLVSVILFYIIM